MQPSQLNALERRPMLKELVDPAGLADLCRSYVDLYGIGVKVFDLDGSRLVDLKVGNGDFCGYVFATPRGRRLCTATVRQVKDTPFDGPQARVVVHTCFTGLTYLVLPILHEGDVLGKAIFGPFRPEDLDDLPESLDDLDPGFDRGEAKRHVKKVRQAPVGTVRRILSHFRMVVDILVHAGYETRLTSAIHIDAVTDSHRELVDKNRRLQEALERLEELDRLKSNFLATVSHELRTPLTSVIGYSEMLLEGLAGNLSEDQRDYVRTIMEKGENLLQIITSMLDLSRIESGRVQLNPVELDVAPVVHEAVTTVHPHAQRKGVHVQVQSADELPTVPADRDKLRQCLVNLLSNAVKFTPATGEVVIEVGRWTGPRSGAVEDGDPARALFEPEENHFMRIAVRDTGIGIPEDQLHRVFDTFYQVDNSSTREFGGTGLGLSIVKSYIEAHGGEVRVESTQGEGSVFTLLLPLEPSTGVPTGLPEGT